MPLNFIGHLFSIRIFFKMIPPALQDVAFLHIWKTDQILMMKYIFSQEVPIKFWKSSVSSFVAVCSLMCSCYY